MLTKNPIFNPPLSPAGQVFRRPNLPTDRSLVGADEVVLPLQIEPVPRIIAEILG
jgi:hypothetical protein